ncbi:hypothetical protein AAMO2058_000955500 [Amorphochlora amoebiformis]
MALPGWRLCAFLLAACATQATITKYELEPYDSSPSPSAVILSGCARFTVLTPHVIRMEFSTSRSFENRPTLAVVNRRLPVPTYTTNENASALVIETSALKLTYTKGQAFHATTLQVESTNTSSAFTAWQYGMTSETDPGNLLGTFRTLDGQNALSLNCSVNRGSRRPPAHCVFGLVSRSGWGLVVDSGVPVLDEDDFWADENGDMLRNSNDEDLYIFAHGHDYAGALRDYTLVGGRIPVVPRYASGVWFTRWFNFGAGEVKDVVEEYERTGIPLDVFVFDMNWHTKQQWTGYSWDRNVLPYPEDILTWLRQEKGLRVAANLHDAQGIREWEDKYIPMCQALNIDPKSTKGINFTLVNRNYTRALEDIVLQPIEKQGMDFWWIDWQQGETQGGTGQGSRNGTMNPTIWLDKMRVTDSIRRCKTYGSCTNRRGMVLARFGGLGNHRYQVGFSGDVANVNWENLAYQPYFTSTASNVGYGFWSHDIVGSGSDPELYTRWIQWASYSPIMRSHDRGLSAGSCTKWPDQSPPDKGCAVVRPYNLPLRHLQAVRTALRSRAKLTPYLYTLSREAFDTGLSPIRPMYYYWPEETMAYSSDQYGNFPQFLLGNDLMIRPVVRPANASSQGSFLAENTKTWIPPGEWVMLSTGRVFKGPKVDTRSYDLEDIPVFARAGSVIIERKIENKNKNAGLTGLARRPLTDLVIRIVPGSKREGSSRVYEDDGETYDYLNNKFAWTTVEYSRSEIGMKISIETKGSYDGLPQYRSISVRVEGIPPVERATINGVQLTRSRFGGPSTYSYDGSDMSSLVESDDIPSSTVSTFELTFAFPLKSPYSLSGLKGLISKARRVKAALDEYRVTPGSHRVEVSYLSKLAGAGEALSYLASTGAPGLKSFRALAANLTTYLKESIKQVSALRNKTQDGRVNYGLALLRSGL